MWDVWFHHQIVYSNIEHPSIINYNYLYSLELLLNQLSVTTKHQNPSPFSQLFSCCKPKKSGLEEPEIFLALETKPDFLNQILGQFRINGVGVFTVR